MGRGLQVKFNAAPFTMYAATGKVFTVGSVMFFPAASLAAPTGLGAQALSSSLISITWNATVSPYLRDYGIYRNGVNIGFTTTNTNFVDSGLAAGTTYTYNVTARNVNNVESPLSAPSSAQTQNSSGTNVTHNQLFSITGSGFGTKTRAAPLKYDDMTTAVGAISPLWDAAQGNQPTIAGGVYNMQMQLASTWMSVGNTGFNPGTPDPFQTKFYAGCHLNLNQGFGGNDVMIGGQWTAPTTPYPLWVRAAQRFDKNWFADPYSDNNLKVFYYSATSQALPDNGDAFYTNWAPTSSILTNAVSGITVANPSVVTIALPLAQNPLVAGHDVALIGMPAGWTSLENTVAHVTAVSGLFNQWHGTLAMSTTGFPPYPTPCSVTGITKGPNAVVSFTSNTAVNPCVVGTILMFQNVGGMTQVNLPLNINMIMKVTAISGTQPNYTATINKDTSAFGTYTSGGTVYFGLGTTPNTNSIVSNQLGTDAPRQPTGGPFMWQDPDANGHNAAFWNNILYPTNPANGWIRKEWEMGISSVTGAAGGGYFNEFDNLARPLFYVGKSENPDPSPFRNFCIGAYSRDRGPNNFRYYGGPIILDIGETGQKTVPRVIIGNASTLAACTITEYAPAASWSDTSITAKFYQGNLPSGSTAYVYVYTGAGGTPTTPVTSVAIT